MRVRRSVLLSFFVVCGVLRISAQQGPPPEIRSHIEALTSAYNSGSVEQWEVMAKEHFAPSALAGHTAEDRKQLFDRMHGDFGKTIALDRAERRGPDAPLDLHVRGATGLEAVIRLQLEASAP